MKKFLGLLALFTLFATPAFAGNSIRLANAGGGGGSGLPLCDPTNCDTDGDVVVWNNTGSCLDCVECADNEVLSWDAATDTWVCDTAGVNQDCAGPSPAAPVDGEILVWDTASSCFTSIGCSDNQLLAWDTVSGTFDCIDVGNLCNAGTCTDNAIIQWNTATECYDCLTCAAGEVLEWSGSDWICISGPSAPSGGACIDDTMGDGYFSDDLEIGDETFMSNEAWVNYCTTMTFQGDSGATDSNQEVSLTVNNLVQGQLGAPDVGAAVGASRTLVLRNQDSGVDETNELVFARGWDVGAGLAATPYGYDLGSVWGYAWDGTDYVRQAGITFKISSDTASGRTGTMTASDGYGAIQFRHHEGVNDAYEVSASAMADLDWEFYDDVFIGQPGGVLGFGSNTETLATCIVDDGADEIFGDRDCDDTVDTAENPLDTYFLEVADGAGATSSFSGLEIGGTDWNDLALLQGCADTEVLSWNDGSNIWECTATSSFGLSDHGALTGLSDDDHALYLDTTAADTFSATNWYTTSDTADGFDTNVLGLSGGGAMADNRGAQLYLYGDDRSITPGWAALEGGTNGNVEVRNNCSTCNLVLDSASDDINMLTTNVDLRLETDGVDFNIPANQLIQFDDGLLAFAGATPGDAATSVCIADDGSDRLFHDTDCDGTKDAGEEYIDQAGGGTLADSCTTIQAGQLDAIESAFSDLGTDTTGTNVRMRYQRFSNSATEYANYIVHVPDSLASAGNVTVTLWTRADGSADASGLGGVWDFEYAGRDDGETYDGAYTNSAFATETYTTLDDTTLHEISQTIAVASFTAGDWLPIRFSRDHDEAADTFDGELDILTAEICFPQE